MKRADNSLQLPALWALHMSCLQVGLACEGLDSFDTQRHTVDADVVDQAAEEGAEFYGAATFMCSKGAIVGR